MKIIENELFCLDFWTNNIPTPVTNVQNPSYKILSQTKDHILHPEKSSVVILIEPFE